MFSYMLMLPAAETQLRGISQTHTLHCSAANQMRQQKPKQKPKQSPLALQVQILLLVWSAVLIWLGAQSNAVRASKAVGAGSNSRFLFGRVNGRMNIVCSVHCLHCFAPTLSACCGQCFADCS